MQVLLLNGQIFFVFVFITFDNYDHQTTELIQSSARENAKKAQAYRDYNGTAMNYTDSNMTMLRVRNH